jgi:glycosyltransferase involved in cell wall biosynthesis
VGADEAKMNISIAMATYNGERYIREQLDSFAAQTLLPDELVICDDCSGDDTLAIVEDFAESAKFRVHFVRNERKLGYTLNFEKALSLCGGDLIFLSDQDDVWFPEKLQIIRDVFRSHPAVEVVINDIEIADAQLKPSGVTQASNTQRAGHKDRGFVNGCSTTITKGWRNVVLPIPPTYAVYDHWIHMAAYYLNKRLVLDNTLQYYRRHEGNTSNWVLSGSKSPLLSRLVIANIFADDSLRWARELLLLRLLYRRFAERLAQTLACGDGRVCMMRIENEIRLLECRLMAVSKPHLERIPSIVRLLASGSYGAARGWKSALRDLLVRRANLPASLLSEIEQI